MVILWFPLHFDNCTVPAHIMDSLIDGQNFDWK